MKKTLQELIVYLKNPIRESDKNINFNYRIKKFGHLLVISLLTGMLIAPIFALIEHFELINMEDHAMEELMKNLTKIQVFIFAAVVAPILEELIFRAPLPLFKNKSSFKIAFYLFTILFGLIHISNFGITTNVLLLMPLLVLPQLLLGGYLGFIRIRFGLIWSIALHAAYNGILILMSFSTQLF